jgi:demethoxyubiquinone hydroxylase (CLK1/Coq7/Cat5 family)
MENYLADCTMWSIVGFALGAVTGYVARKKRDHDHA